ncbi:MAG TPA: methionyl-tRNA formyltransferase [Candidatus Agrococcus pullicola]|uniref:Methionyl-tRNA formyltransferase n=1 Tax=Candidatus Agrococcus pullicola TaxID=2838429 RepID=A0A9D1YUG6_9MICO|nr:methionyl-tRNA formyltransferase [Candidatus Agrococcus pullicola]
MKIVFAGSPEVAVPTLRALSAEHDVLAVLTREPAPVGRRRTRTATPVAVAARELGIPVIESNRPDGDVTDRVVQLRPDLGVVIAYGAMLRSPLLNAPKHGWVNLHFSALPKHRGASPLQSTILAGEREAGLSVFRLVPELDAGDVVVQQSSPLGPDETAGEALARLAHEGVGAVVTAVNHIGAGTAVFTPQSGETSYAPKLTRQDGELDFTRDAASIYARFRGVTPEPGAWTNTEIGAVKILAMRPVAEYDEQRTGVAALEGKRAIVTTSDGAFELLRVQPPGKAAMDGDAWLRGRGGFVQLLTAEEAQ